MLLDTSPTPLPAAAHTTQGNTTPRHCSSSSRKAHCLRAPRLGGPAAISRLQQPGSQYNNRCITTASTLAVAAAAPPTPVSCTPQPPRQNGIRRRHQAVPRNAQRTLLLRTHSSSSNSSSSSSSSGGSVGEGSSSNPSDTNNPSTNSPGASSNNNNSLANDSTLRRIVFGGGDGSFARSRNNNNSSSSGSSNANNSNSSWALMGRVVQPGQLTMGSNPRQRLVLIAAARHAGVSEGDMAARVQSLITLLPDLSSMIVSLSPITLAQLTQDTAGLAHKLIQLRVWFPSADVAAMVARRPTLLLDEQWAHVDSARLRLLARLLPPAQQAQPTLDTTTTNVTTTTTTTTSSSSSSSSNAQPEEAAAAAAAGYAAAIDPTTSSNSSQKSSDVAAAAAAAGGGDSSVVGGVSVSAGIQQPLQTSPLLDGLVSRQPLLLVANVDELLDELTRLLPSVDVMSALQRDPDLVTSIMCNRNLSIWFYTGVDVLLLLERNPSLLFSVQRGTSTLGPGAEFMGQG